MTISAEALLRAIQSVRGCRTPTDGNCVADEILRIARELDAARPQAWQAGTQVTDAQIAAAHRAGCMESFPHLADLEIREYEARYLRAAFAALESFAANRPAGDEQQGRFADRPEKTLDKARNLVFALSSVLGQRTKDSDEVTLSGRQANDITTVCRAYLAEYDALERYGIPPQQEPKS